MTKRTQFRPLSHPTTVTLFFAETASLQRQQDICNGIVSMFNAGQHNQQAQLSISKHKALNEESQEASRAVLNIKPAAKKKPDVWQDRTELQACIHNILGSKGGDLVAYSFD